MKAATLPYEYARPRFVNGVLRTCRLVEIGLLHRVQSAPEIGAEAEQLQAALIAPQQQAPEATMHTADRLVLRGSLIAGAALPFVLFAQGAFK